VAAGGTGGLSGAAIEGCIALADLPVAGGGPTIATNARAELAALTAAAERAAALSAACTLPDIDRALADLGVATTPTIVPDERRRAAVETVRTFLRVLRTVVAAVDAGGGAAGARDEIADLAVAFVRARDGAGTTVDDPATDVADVDAAVVAYVGALDALADAVQRLDALRAGGAGETGG
jgi:hypothetical protein